MGGVGLWFASVVPFSASHKKKRFLQGWGTELSRSLGCGFFKVVSLMVCREGGKLPCGVFTSCRPSPPWELGGGKGGARHHT